MHGLLPKRLFPFRKTTTCLLPSVPGRLLLSLLTCLWVVNAAPTAAQENYILQKISFEGNRVFSDGRLLEQMTLKGRTWWSRFLIWKEPLRYEENELQRDLQRILELYFREGFVDARIDTVLFQTDDARETVSLIIRINEGEPVQIGSIDYVPLTADSAVDIRARNLIKQLRKRFQLRVGQRYRDELLVADRDLLITEFSNDGFPYVTVRPQMGLDRDEKLIDVVFLIDPGPLCYFGDVEIVGNERTPASVIRKQLVFRKGQLFRQNALQRSQQQIYQLGVFQFVTLRLRFEHQQSDSVAVQVVVREAPSLTAKIGFGYGREDQARGFVDLRRLNFLGGARRLSLFAKHSGLEPFNINLSLTQPAFLLAKMMATLNPFYREEKEPGFRAKRVGANFIVQHQVNRITDASLNYNLQQVQVDIPEQTRLEALDSVRTSLYNQSSVTLTVVQDNSGPIFEPTRGQFTAITLTYSGIGFQSDFNYWQAVVEVRKYKQLWEPLVFAGRVKVGVMGPLQSGLPTPIEERFFAGGSNSMRGWARSQLGPKNSEGRPVGGNSILELSFEARFPIWQWFSGVIFLDIGNVWQETFYYNLQALHYAAGTGLRIRTPIGPLRVDIGKAVTDRQVPWQLHLSIGHAF